MNIPINEQWIIEHEEFYDEFNNIIAIELSEKEYSLVNDIFTEWNKKFDILIDIYEEETLENEHCAEALAILNEYRAAHTDADPLFWTAAAKLEEAVQLAIQYGTCVYLDF